MHPKLLGNPLVAWRDDRTVQIGWGDQGVVVESAPPRLPQWLTLLSGQTPRATLLAAGREYGLEQGEADHLLVQLQRVGLLAGAAGVAVTIAATGMIVDPLADALRAAGVSVLGQADVVVFPQGQLPTLAAAPGFVRRLIPVWFSGPAVHVGPVLDSASGPCPRCIDLTWADHDPIWPRLVAQAATLGLWGTPAQVAHAATAVAAVARSPRTVGLEMIIDESNPGPCWRVWSVHPGCDCQRT